MNRIFVFHDIFRLCLTAPRGEFSDYLEIEFAHGRKHASSKEDMGAANNQKDENLPTINIEVDSIIKTDGDICALGKGLFFNETSREILFCQNRDTSFYDPNSIYASITDFFGGTQNGITIKILSSKIEKRGFESWLKGLYRKYIVADLRSLGRKNAESVVSQFVEPNLYRVGLRTGHVLLHAAALSRRGKGILVFGPQNIGKTTISIGLSRLGWGLLGDDLCFLNQESTLKSYLKPLKLEREFLKHFADSEIVGALKTENQNNTLAKMFQLLIGKRKEVEIKVPASVLGVVTENSARLTTAIFLQRRYERKKEGSVVVEKLVYEDAVALCEQHIVAEFDVNKHLDRDIRQSMALFYRKSNSLSLLAPETSKIIKAALKDVDSYMVTLNTPDANALAAISEIVE